MLVEREDPRLCEECGEPMEVVRDYGISGQALVCKACGYSVEEIDLHKTKLSDV